MICDIKFTFQNLNKFFDDHTIRQDKYDIKLILHTIANISNNHHRSPQFFNKIEKIIKILIEDIKKFYSDIELFNIFKENKRLLLFLFEEKIITPDKNMFNIITKSEYKSKNYPQYFFHEFKSFYTKKLIEIINEEKIDYESESFFAKRRIGENDGEACELIRNDSVDEFVAKFGQKTHFWGMRDIKDSIFETNPFLIEKNPGYLEYSAFFGSTKIFKHLLQNEKMLNNKILAYAIHSNNTEIIHLIEQKLKIESSDEKSVKSFIESLKCHHIEITDYLFNKYFKNNEVKNEIPYLCLKFYNFINFNDDLINEVTQSYKLCNASIDDSNDDKKLHMFCALCESDYISFVDLFLKTMNININKPFIYKLIFFV